MSRLTCKYDDLNALRELCTFDRESDIEADDCEDCKEYCYKHCDYSCEDCAMQRAFDKLAEYEDLEEQGLLLKLPCKVGDKAYYVNKGHIDEVEIDSFVLNINLFVNVSYYIGCERFGKTLTPYKTLFFTKEEAEKALKEMESAE